MKTSETGYALVGVVFFTALVAVLAAGLLTQSLTQMRIANKQLLMEKALYTAEAGVEHAIPYIMLGGSLPATITNTVGEGSFSAIIYASGSTMTSSPSGAGEHTVSGSLNLNPNNSPDNEFMLVTPDGRVITRDDLHNDDTVYTSAPCVFYEGPAVYIRVKPKGNGNQNTLEVDGEIFDLQNGTTYEFQSASMTLRIMNTQRNPGNGKAMGQWWLDNIDGTGVTLMEDSTVASGALTSYGIYSLGTVNGVMRAVTIDGVRQQTWARYALWYDRSSTIWFISGEKFYGPVHANCELSFWPDSDPEFFAKVTSASSTYGGNTNNVIFHDGFDFPVFSNSMASVNFTNLESKAGLVLEGNTAVRFSGTNLFVNNSRAGLDNNIPIPAGGLLYIKQSTTGASGTRDGTIKIGGQLDGRLTIVADRDILITNHCTYAAHPTNASQNALGLISGRNVKIEDQCPNNVNVFAHIMATGRQTASTDDGMFTVTSYSSGSPRGTMTVYGGIVQDVRGPVGQASSGTLIHGYYKNYIYDARFADNPPPHYPPLVDQYAWTTWRESPF